jgi:hypothetical protein
MDYKKWLQRWTITIYNKIVDFVVTENEKKRCDIFLKMFKPFSIIEQPKNYTLLGVILYFFLFLLIKELIFNFCDRVSK